MVENVNLLHTSTMTSEQNGSAATSGNNSDIFNIPLFEQKYWIECESILIALTVIAVYMFLCISLYASKKRTRPSREIGGGKEGKRLYLMLVLASGFTVLRSISNHIVAFTSSYSNKLCFATLAVSTVLYAFGVFSVYLFLWMRQSIFYANPVLSKVLNKAVTLASWCCLILLVITAVCLTVLYNVPYVNGWDYQVTSEGCKGVLVGNGEIVSGLVTATTTTFQILLLILFVYPLLSRKTQRYRSAGNRSCNTNGGNQASLSNTDDNITDGGNSTSIRHHEKRKVMKSLSSENESGVDVTCPGDGPHVSSRSTPTDESSRNESIVNSPTFEDPEPGNHKYPATNKDSPRKSKLMSKLQHPGKIFYRRNVNTKVKGTNGLQRNSDGLVLPPADKCQKDRADSGKTGSKSKRPKLRRSKTQQGRRMMAFLKKAFCLMLICITTDIACTVVQAQVNFPEIVYLVIFDINLIINIVCIVMSFRHWDSILFPMFSSCKIGNANNSENEASSGSDKRKAADAERYKCNGFSTPSKATSVAQGSYQQRDPHANDHNIKQLDLNGKT